MADYSLRRIDEIKLGDKVLSVSDRDDANKLGELPPLHAGTVEVVYVRAARVIVHIRLGDDEIKTTRAHPFFVVGRGWVNAEDLSVDDALLSADGHVEEISSLEIVPDPEIVYNLSIAEHYTYFANGILVHNATAAGAFSSFANGDIREGASADIFESLSTGVSEMGMYQN